MRSGVPTHRRTVPRSAWIKRSAIIAGCVVLLIVAIALVARDAIERAWLQHALVGALDADVTLGALHHRGESTVLEGVRIHTPLGTTLTADSVVYRTNGDDWDVAPAGLHLSLERTNLSFADAPRFASAAHDLGIRHALIHVHDAGLDIRDEADVKLIEVAGITGDVHAGDRVTYALDGTWVDDVAATGAYPVSAKATTDGGRTVHAFSAAALPLAGAGAALGGAHPVLAGGIAHALAASDDGGWHATMTVAEGNLSLTGVRVDHIAGPVTIVADGAGSPGLNATLQPAGIPLAITGEVHDVKDWTAGSRDLRMLADMIGRIGSQANLRWSNVETLAPGAVYGQYAMTTKDVPHVVQLVAMDGHEPTLHFDTALADDHIISKGARTSDLGVRTKAIAGINGDYFDIGRTYEPQGLLIRSGTLLHGPTDHEALIIDRTNRPTFARFHLRGTVADGARRYPLTLYNSWPTREVAFITPDYGPELRAAPGVTFVALAPVDATHYRVTGSRPMTTSMTTVLGLGFGDDVHGALPKIGDVLDVRYALDPGVDGAVAGIGSGPLLLKDGRWYEDAHAPAPDERDVQWPVIAAGTFADGTLVFAAVDGRHPERSIGMTRPEFAELLRRFGVTDAMALDSGGSVTMVARAPGAHDVTLHNVPSDNSAERYVSDALFAYSTAPEGTIVASPRPHVEPSPLAK